MFPRATNLDRVFDSAAFHFVGTKGIYAFKFEKLMLVNVPRQSLETSQDYMKRYPRIVSHIICESLGYATPSCAARILKDAKDGNANWCEWTYSCYERDPRPAVRSAIRGRHTHHGFMAEYKLARSLVQQAIETGEEPLLASWF